MDKILVVDDDTEILKVIKLILTMDGFEVEVVSEWEDAFQKVNTFKPDLILLDICLGGEDGRNISRKIKSKESLKHIHIVLFSAKSGVQKHFSECLADDFIAKPFDAQQLLDKIYERLSKNPGLN
ncbi:MAG: response regulator [Ginsengibacter sp.]